MRIVRTIVCRFIRWYGSRSLRRGGWKKLPSLNRRPVRKTLAVVIGLAGGGVGGGALYGASDRIGAYPAREPATPGDVAATIFWRHGVNPATEVLDQTGRPFRLAEGQPLAPLFSSST